MIHPVDVFTYCPRCGASGFRAVSCRSLKCSKCGFLFYINTAAAVAALIFNEEGKLLVTRRGVEPDAGMLDLPGGFVDPGENAEDALRRELNEELGIKVRKLRYLASCPNEYLFSGITIFTTDLAFRVFPVSVEDLHPADDIAGYEWVYPEEVCPEEIPATSIRFFIKKTAIDESRT